MHDCIHLKQTGMSMIELMISCIISIFITTTLCSIYVASSETLVSIRNNTSLQEGIRAAYNVIRDDIFHSGNFQGIGIESNLSNMVNGSEKVVANSMVCPDISSGINFALALDQPIFAVNDSVAGYGCLLDGKYIRGDFLIIRYVKPFTGGFDDNSLYFKNSLQFGVLFKGKDALLPENDIPFIDIAQIVSHGYFVGDSGRQCSGQVVPSLFRLTIDPYNSNSIGLQEILPGVENLQVTFLESGQYKNSESIINWKNIRSVKLDILMRSECAVSLPDRNIIKTYSLGDIVYKNVNDNFKRELITQVIALRN